MEILPFVLRILGATILMLISDRRIQRFAHSEVLAQHPDDCGDCSAGFPSFLSCRVVRDDCSALSVSDARLCPGPPASLEVKPSLWHDVSSGREYPSVAIKWSAPRDGSYSFLTGFRVSIVDLTGDELCWRLDLKNASLAAFSMLKFSIPNDGCLLQKLHSNTVYDVAVMSLPSPPGNFPDSMKSLRVRTRFSQSRSPHTWSTTMSHQVIGNGVIRVEFLPAPDHYNLDKYLMLLVENSTALITRGQVVVRRPNTSAIFTNICPGTYYIMIEPEKYSQGQCVCLDEDHRCKDCVRSVSNTFKITEGAAGCTITPQPVPVGPNILLIGICSAGSVLVACLSTVTVIACYRRTRRGKRMHDEPPPSSPLLLISGPHNDLAQNHQEEVLVSVAAEEPIAYSEYTGDGVNQRPTKCSPKPTTQNTGLYGRSDESGDSSEDSDESCPGLMEKWTARRLQRPSDFSDSGGKHFSASTSYKF